MFHCTKFKRGQVWMVDDIFTGAKYRCKSHLLAKPRPYLILTDDNVLESESENFLLIQAIPITSTTDGLYATHPGMIFQSFNGMNRVLIDQVTSIDAKFFKRYLYTVSAAMMNEISKLIIARINLTKTSVSLNDIVTKYAPDALNENVIPETANNTDSKKTVIIKTENTCHTKTRRTWTISMASDFLKLYGERNFEQIMIKYGFNNKKQIYNMASYAKTLVRK